MNILQVTRSMRVPQLVKISNVVDLVRVKGYKIHMCPQVVKLQINNHNVKAYKNYEQIPTGKITRCAWPGYCCDRVQEI